MKHVFMEQRIEKVHQLLVKAEIELSEIRNIFLMQCQHTLKPIHQGVGSESFSNDPTGYVCTKCDAYFEAAVEEKSDKFLLESDVALSYGAILIEDSKNIFPREKIIKQLEHVNWLDREMNNQNFPGPTKL